MHTLWSHILLSHVKSLLFARVCKITVRSCHCDNIDTCSKSRALVSCSKLWPDLSYSNQNCFHLRAHKPFVKKALKSFHSPPLRKCPHPPIGHLLGHMPPFDNQGHLLGCGSTRHSFILFGCESIWHSVIPSDVAQSDTRTPRMWLHVRDGLVRDARPRRWPSVR